jgi:mRNA interferase RelE/StbE
VKSAFTSSFLRDLRKIAEPDVLAQVRGAIVAVESAPDIRSTPSLKKLSGAGPYFRIRVGEYRVGLRIEGETATFVRVLPRRDIYRYFP